MVPGSPENRFSILLVEDDHEDADFVRTLLAEFTDRRGLHVADDLAAGLEQLAKGPVDVILLDLSLPDSKGLDSFLRLRSSAMGTPIVILSGLVDEEIAVEAVRLGAQDYLLKQSLDQDRLVRAIRFAIERERARSAAIRDLPERSGETESKSAERVVWGQSPRMQELRRIVEMVAPTEASVLLVGESGTGKEVVARWIHQHSPRAGGPWVPLNMSAMPRDLVESTLFGHERGAFTGAEELVRGAFETAEGGTLFLDEIGEMDISLQPKLLRVLQDGTFRRVGGSREMKAKVRVIAATNRNAEEMVRRGTLREDLYYRLHVVPITIPPLRERREDIRLLAEHLLALSPEAEVKGIVRFAPDAMDQLEQYDWPGNVRQLENTVRRLAIFAPPPEIRFVDLPEEIRVSATEEVSTTLLYRLEEPSSTMSDREERTPKASLPPIPRAERAAILEALRNADGNVADAARTLEVGLSTLYRKLRRYDIDPGQFR